MSERVAAVLTYNSSGIIEPCLNALQNQEGWRIVVVDNNSQDQDVTAEVVASQYPEATFIRHDENHGYAGGYNRVLHRLGAEGVRQVALLNPDAIVQSDCLNMMADTLAADPQAIIATPLVKTPDGAVDNAGGEMDWEAFRPIYYGRGGAHADLLGEKRQVELATGACMLLSLPAYQELGPMDESYFLYWEETDYCLQAARRGYRIWYEPRAQVVHPKRSSSTTMTDAETTYYYTRNSLYCAEKFKGEKYIEQMIARFLINQVGYQLKREGTELADELTSVLLGIKDYQLRHKGAMPGPL